MMKWMVFNNAEAVAIAACEYLCSAAEKAIADHASFHLLLAGGSTPERCYELLAKVDNEWGKWHLWFGDERCLPRNDPQRNSEMVNRALSSKVAIPESQIHIIPAELGPARAAELYAKELKAVSMFDVVLLGMGEDGHTASLFPNGEYSVNSVKDDVLAIYDAVKPPLERVSLNYSKLGHSRKVVFLVTGENKKEALNGWQQGKDLPVSRVKSTGEMCLFTDQRPQKGIIIDNMCSPI